MKRSVLLLNNNIDVNQLLQALSKMNKSELEAGISKANQMLKSKSKDEILKEFNGNNK